MRLFELTEGYWKNIDIANQERRASAPPISIPSPAQKFHVLIRGKTWMKDGKPVEFTSQEKAAAAATTISNRYRKTTQVVPAK